MAKMGGARPGAGRKPGSGNRRHAAVALAALGNGVTPVAFMLKIMHDEEAELAARRWAAEKVAPYLHPRPAAMDRMIQLDLPDTSAIAGIDQALDRIIAAIGSGAISPGEGQSLMSVIETRRKAIETGDLLERIKRLEDGQR